MRLLFLLLYCQLLILGAASRVRDSKIICMIHLLYSIEEFREGILQSQQLNNPLHVIFSQIKKSREQPGNTQDSLKLSGKIISRIDLVGTDTLIHALARLLTRIPAHSQDCFQSTIKNDLYWNQYEINKQDFPAIHNDISPEEKVLLTPYYPSRSQPIRGPPANMNASDERIKIAGGILPHAASPEISKKFEALGLSSQVEIFTLHHTIVEHKNSIIFEIIHQPGSSYDLRFPLQFKTHNGTAMELLVAVFTPRLLRDGEYKAFVRDEYGDWHGVGVDGVEEASKDELVNYDQKLVCLVYSKAKPLLDKPKIETRPETARAALTAEGSRPWLISIIIIGGLAFITAAVILYFIARRMKREARIRGNTMLENNLITVVLE